MCTSDSHDTGYTKSISRIFFNSYNEGETQINLKELLFMMTREELTKMNGVYVNNCEGYAVAKAKYSELVKVVGVHNVCLHTIEGKIKVTNESKEG